MKKRLLLGDAENAPIAAQIITESFLQIKRFSNMLSTTTDQRPTTVKERGAAGAKQPLRARISRR